MDTERQNIMAQITINYAGNPITRNVSETTVGALLANANYQAALGFGPNVTAKIDGVVQAPTARLVDGDVVYIEDRASSKA